ncbi:MAG: hypothetical protein RRZ85_06160 [Gordonibacter sp.]|uniref:hypothetical protein n=1 Tax=Gordonibacter sp. TaxID=1968902 RepID=UPI002FC6694D
MSAAARRGLTAALALGMLLAGALVVDAVLAQSRPGIFVEAAGAFVSPPVRDGPSAEAPRFEEDVASESGGGERGESAVSNTLSSGALGLPEGFENEVLPVGQLSDLRVNDTGTVVGFSLPAEPVDAFGLLAQSLSDRGWRAVPAGGGSSGTFVKEEGRFIWLYIACVRVGDTTSVVVQCATTQRKD